MDYKIMSYLKGRLSAEEAALFEKEIADDAALRKEVTLQRFEMEGMESLVREDLLKKVAQWKVEEADKGNEEHRTNPKSPWWGKLRNWIMLSIILACLALITISIISHEEFQNYYGKEKKSSNKRFSSESPQASDYKLRGKRLNPVEGGLNNRYKNLSAKDLKERVSFFPSIIIVLILTLFVYLCTIRLLHNKKRIKYNNLILQRKINLFIIITGCVILILLKIVHGTQKSKSEPRERNKPAILKKLPLRQDTIPQVNNATPILKEKSSGDKDKELGVIAMYFEREEIKKISSDSRDIQVPLPYAFNLFEAGRYAEVILLLQEQKIDTIVLSSDSAFYSIVQLDLLGHSLMMEGRYNEAAQTFRNIINQPFVFINQLDKPNTYVWRFGNEEVEPYTRETVHPAEWNLLLSLLPNYSKNKPEADRLLQKMLKSNHIYQPQAKKLQALIN